MNKREFAEFHKCLAMLIYEYNKFFLSPNITEETRTKIGETLEHLNEVMKICIIDGSEINE